MTGQERERRTKRRGLRALLGASVLLALGGLAGCSDQPAPAASTPGARLVEAPFPKDVNGLDPAAVELLHRAADALNADVERPELWTELGMALHAHQQLELARTCYEQRLLRDDEDAHTWYYLALIEDELGETQQAREHYERTRSLDAKYPPAQWHLGLLLLGEGRIDEAEAAMQAALAIAPEDPASVVGMARVRIQQGRFDDAVVLLEDHLDRVPKDDNARFLLGTAYRSAGRAEEAARALGGVAGAEPVRRDPWLDDVLAHRQGFRTDFLMAVDLLGKGDVARATELLEKLKERRPDDTLVLVNLHRAYRMAGDIDRAIELLVEAREIDPLSDIVHLHLAGAYRDKARMAGEVPDPTLLLLALESIQRACELSPTYAAAHGMRGDVLFTMKHVPEACDAWMQAAKLDPQSVMWQEKAGQSLCQNGRWGEAVPFLRQLDVLQPGSTRTLLFLAAALANSGQLAEARDPLERAQKIAPDDPSIQKALADLERASAVPVPSVEAPAQPADGTIDGAGGGG